MSVNELVVVHDFCLGGFLMTNFSGIQYGLGCGRCVVNRLFANVLMVITTLVAHCSVAPVLADDVQNLADKIDRHMESRWNADGIVPAPIANDAEFLRRVSLHVNGAIPTVSETRQFLRNESLNRRRQIVDEMLESPRYIINFSNFWTRVLMPESATDFQAAVQLPGFQLWLRQNLANNTHYDALVYELLTIPLEGERGANVVMQNIASPSPVAFFTTKQIKPENLAAATSRMFMGIRIECAQCHNHPHDVWKQEHFWGYAAFFAGIERITLNEGETLQVKEVPDRRELSIPERETVVQASYLDGTQPQWRAKIGSRRTLAEWLTSKQNPYFAKAVVNRIWGHLFGVGIVNPVDDFGGANPPSHSELLEELASDFAAHDFDLKYLIRSMTASMTYQRTSRKTHESQSEPQQFARMAVQGLSGEQLYDSIAIAVGHFDPFQAARPYQVNQPGPRTEFLELFPSGNTSSTERQTTILQALSMMNGDFTATSTSLEQSSTLAAVADFPLMTASDRIESLFLATLTRKPTQDELQRLKIYAESGGASKNQKQALTDIYWALLNSSEFLFNH